METCGDYRESEIISEKEFYNKTIYVLLWEFNEE